MRSASILVVEDLHIRPAEEGTLEEDLLVPVPVPVVDIPVVDRIDLEVGHHTAADQVVDHRSLLAAGRIDLVVGLHNPGQAVDHRSLLVRQLELTHPSCRMRNRYYRATT